MNADSSHAMVSLVPQKRWVGKLSPLQLLKAIKNETERKGMREAHVSLMSICDDVIVHHVMVRTK